MCVIYTSIYMSHMYAAHFHVCPSCAPRVREIEVVHVYEYVCICV